MHKVKALDGRSKKALRERGLDERETTSQQWWVQRGQQANDGEPTTATVRKGLGLGIREREERETKSLK